jgi:hypothetical protein
MTADKSTANVSFFYFFSELVKLAFAARSEQLFTLSSGSRNKLGELGLRLRERTIVQNAPRQHGCSCLQMAAGCVNEQLVNLGTGRTIVQNSTGCVTCGTPKPEQLFTLGSR